MFQRAYLFVVLGAAATAPLALADAVRVDVTISYFPQTLMPQPPPIFQNSLLTGSIQFYNEVDVNGQNFQAPSPPPIDIGNVATGGQFSTFFQPSDPCV